MLSANEVAKKWAANTGNSQASVKAGVQAVTEAPSAKAVRQKDAMRANFLRSIDDGTWERNTGRVTLEQWRAAMLNKGVQRMQDGVAGATAKVESFLSSFLPFVKQVVDSVNASTPRGSLAQNVQRAVAVMNGLANYRRGLGGSM